MTKLKLEEYKFFSQAILLGSNRVRNSRIQIEAFVPRDHALPYYLIQMLNDIVQKDHQTLKKL